MSIYAVNGKEPIAAWIESLDPELVTSAKATDLIGTNHGTLTNMDLTADPDTARIADTDAGGVRALRFSDTDDRVITGTGINITSTVFSVSLWVRRIKTTMYFPRIIDISDGTNSFQVLSDDGSGGTEQLTTKHTQFQTGLTSTKWGAIGDNVWVHLAISVNSSTGSVSLWIDGTAATGSSGGVTGARSAANNIVLGTRLDVSSITTLTGRMDDIRVWDQGLIAADASYLYSGGFGRGIVASTGKKRPRINGSLINSGLCRSRT